MKKFTGKVLHTKLDKTAMVEVNRLWQHPLYKKRIKRSKKYLVDDQLGVKEGDKVIIEECRPISKKKRFKIVEVVDEKVK